MGSRPTLTCRIRSFTQLCVWMIETLRRILKGIFRVPTKHYVKPFSVKHP